MDEDLINSINEWDSILALRKELDLKTKEAENLYLKYLDADFVSFEKMLGGLSTMDENILTEVIINNFDKINTSRESRLYTLLTVVSQKVILSIKEMVSGIPQIKFEEEAPKMRELGIGEKYTTADMREFQIEKQEFKKRYEDYRDKALTRLRIVEYLDVNYTEDLYRDTNFDLSSPHIYFTFFELGEDSLEIFIKEVVKSRFTELDLVKRIYIDDVATSYPLELKAKKVKFFFSNDEDMNTFYDNAIHVLEAIFLKYKLMRETMAKTDSIFGKYDVDEINATFNLNNTIAAPFTVANLNSNANNHIPYIEEEEEEVSVELTDCYYAYNNDQVVIVDKDYYNKHKSVRYIKNLIIDDMPTTGVVNYNAFIYSMNSDALDYVKNNAEYLNELDDFLYYTESQQEILSELSSIKNKFSIEDNLVVFHYYDDMDDISFLIPELTYHNSNSFMYYGTSEDIIEKLTRYPFFVYQDKSSNYILESYTEPTNLFIVGTIINNSTSFQITDDYAGFNVVCNGTTNYLECDGFVSIVEYNVLRQFLISHDITTEYDMETMGLDIIDIRNVTGDIILKAFDDDGVDIMNTLDINDYLEHQSDSDDLEIQLCIDGDVTMCDFDISKMFPVGHTQQVVNPIVNPDRNPLVLQRLHFLLLNKISNECWDESLKDEYIMKAMMIYQSAIKDISDIEYAYLETLPVISSSLWKDKISIYTGYMYANSPYFKQLDSNDILLFQK